MNTLLLLLPLFPTLPLPAGQDELIGQVPYVKRETRAETFDGMIQALMPTQVTWGDFHQLGAFPFTGHGTNGLATPYAPEDELVARYRANGPGPDLARTYTGKKDIDVGWRNLGRRAHSTHRPALQRGCGAQRQRHRVPIHDDRIAGRSDAHLSDGQRRWPAGLVQRSDGPLARRAARAQPDGRSGVVSS